jgi:chromosome segregation ATPase
MKDILERLKSELSTYTDPKAHMPQLCLDAYWEVRTLREEKETLRKALENHGEECAEIQKTMARLKKKSKTK